MIKRHEYLFTLEQDYTLRHKVFRNAVYSYTTQSEPMKISMHAKVFQNEWITIDSILGELTIKAGYSWDGNTPKFKTPIGIIGTPDGRINPETGKPITYYASLVHDALYQFIEQHKMPRKDIDDLYLEMLEQVGFKHSRLYYRAVRWFGGIFIALTR